MKTAEQNQTKTSKQRSKPLPKTPTNENKQTNFKHTNKKKQTNTLKTFQQNWDKEKVREEFAPSPRILSVCKKSIARNK